MRSLSEEWGDSGDRADMTPLIDCVFLLLLFFIVAATFSDESLFEVELPTVAHAAETRILDDNTVRVAISADGDYAIGKETIAPEQLFATLRDHHADHPIEAIIIAGDQDSPLEHTVRLIDTAHALNIGFSIVVNQP